MVRLALSTVVLAVALAGRAMGGEPAESPPCRVTAPGATRCANLWAGGDRFVVHAGSAGQKSVRHWRYDFAANRDLRLDVEATDGDQRQSGTFFLIGNRAVLTSGLTLPLDQEIDALEVPLLTLQLIVDLLGHALPDGPGSIPAQTRLDHSEHMRAIKFAHGNTRGLIPVPWLLKGVVERSSPTTLSFDLSLSFTPELQEADELTLNFSGLWEKSPLPEELPDATRIDGWAIHRLVQSNNLEPGQAISGIEIVPSDMSFPTLGALREHITGKPVTKGP